MPAWVITKPVWYRFHGNRMRAAHRTFNPSRNDKAANHEVP